MKEYYVGVCDVTTYHGKIDNLKQDDFFRFISTKFVDSPETAFLNIIDRFFNEKGTRWNCTTKEQFLELFKGIQFDSENNEYYRDVLFTENWNIPTKHQKEQYLKGNYSFYKRFYNFQILKTNLIKQEDLFNNAKLKFINERWK